MDDITMLRESLGAPVKKGKRWLVTVARPGKGSSGEYPEHVLKETGPLAIPAGTKAFFNHDSKRDVRDMVGTYKDGAFWNEEEGELQAYLTPFPRYASVLDEAGENVEASIHVAAIKDQRNIVRELVYQRDNTVDLVSFGGLEGSGLKYQVESLFAGAAALSEEGKEENMEITKDMWDAQTALVNEVKTAFLNFVNESKQAAQGVADDAAVSAAAQALVSEALAAYRVAEAAIDEAKLPETVAESLKARAEAGEDIADDLAALKTVVEEVRKETVPAPQGRVRGNVVVVAEELSSDASQTIIPGRWSKR